MFFVLHAISHAKKDIERFEIIDYDLDRIYLKVNTDHGQYIIRTWDITEELINYTVYYEKELNDVETVLDYDTYCF